MLTPFQIRTARAALRFSTRELADIVGVHPRTMYRMENWDNDFGVPPCRPITLRVLYQYFKSHGVLFSQDGLGVALDKAKISKSQDANEKQQAAA